MNKWITKTSQGTHYLRTDGEKPPIILLHGLTASGACWSYLAKALEKEYDVIMPDARGHGGSSSPEEGYCYDTLAKDLVNFIDALDIPPPILLGHSMGGMTAALVASWHPKRLRGLVLVDPTFLTSQRQKEVSESSVVAQHHNILNRSKEHFAAEIRQRHPNRSNELIQQITQARFATNPHAFEILTPHNLDYKELIRTLTIPTFLVIGGINGVVSPLMAEELIRLNPSLQISQIKEAGHGIPYDQPEQLSLIVKAFLDQITPE